MTEYHVCTSCGLTVFAAQTVCPSCGASTAPDVDPLAVEIWHAKANGVCVDCGTSGRVRRLVQAKSYDAETKTPEFRCHECSETKLGKLLERGIPV